MAEEIADGAGGNRRRGPIRLESLIVFDGYGCVAVDMSIRCGIKRVGVRSNKRSKRTRLRRPIEVTE
jgi:hypothetical protein